MKASEQKQQALSFIERWQGKGEEEQMTQRFWLDLLGNVFNVERATDAIEFEKRVKLTHVSKIDAYIADTKVLIEQKSIDVDLTKSYKQSDGEYCTPYEQAHRYNEALPYSEKARFIVVCNFKEFLIYDQEKPQAEPERLFLENLADEYYRLSFLVDLNAVHIKKQFDVSVQAGKLVGVIYDAIHKEYKDPTNEFSLKSLNILCVRLVFCLYAEDAGLFLQNQFSDYLSTKEAKDLRRAIIDLFDVLNTKEEDRDPYLSEDLARFPYVNGGLFAKTDIEIPNFTDEIKDILVGKAGEEFNWSKISPTIFGAIFESTLNPETRREGGMHYTSINNIHKVIDPLFLNELKEELDNILSKIHVQDKKRDKAKSSIGLYEKEKEVLRNFQNKLASLTFLDPACGSGNFLTETYLSLRRLENIVLTYLSGTSDLFIEDTVKVNISQFYGIEINDFAVAVAKTAMWIAEAQMLEESNAILRSKVEFLPLKSYVNIVEDNALRLDWSNIIGDKKLNYIIGNPPFVGARLMTKEQKQDLIDVSNNQKGIGDLDYVGAWYFKAISFLDTNEDTLVAFVSTNSIAQGQQPALLWKNLLNKNISINFAYRSFMWDSEAKVHCVIIGFGKKVSGKKVIYDNDSKLIVSNISPYLIDSKSILIDKRKKPLCDVEQIGIGCMPIDGGQYLFNEKDMNEFINREPKSKVFFKQWYGSDEFIKGKKRFFLYLGNTSPSTLKEMPLCLDRIKKVKEFRNTSTRALTRKLANNPTKLGGENIPTSDFLVIPKTSSENRLYIPIGFMESSCLAGDALFIFNNATLYDFGILTSSVHMAWVRAIAGRLETRYRYSVDLVYNNFIWPIVDEKHKANIEKTAQAILDARAIFPDSSLADLYDDTLMPIELRKAHEANDKAVLKAYGFVSNLSESEILEKLFNLYVKKIEELESENKV